MKTLTNRSMYETNRNEMVNELQALGFDRAKLVKAGENDLHHLYCTMVRGVGITKETREKFLKELSQEEKTSNCCNAPIVDLGNTGEGICRECKEHCQAE